MAAIQKAIRDGDPARLGDAAHAFGGAMANLVAAAALKPARRLEAMARAGHVAGAASEFAILEGEIARLTTALLAFVREKPVHRH